MPQGTKKHHTNALATSQKINGKNTKKSRDQIQNWKLQFGILLQDTSSCSDLQQPVVRICNVWGNHGCQNSTHQSSYLDLTAVSVSACVADSVRAKIGDEFPRSGKGGKLWRRTVPGSETVVTWHLSWTYTHSICDTMHNKQLQWHSTQLQFEVQGVLEVH